MLKPLVMAVVTGVVAFGCKTSAPRPAAAAPRSVDAGPAATADAVDTAAHSDATDPTDAATPVEPARGDKGSLPPPRFKDLPGWLGFATAPEADLKHGWTPQHPTAEVVVFSEDWGTAPKGTRLQAITREGQVALTFQGAAPHPYGCEDNTQVMATFDAQKRAAEGPVWLLPAEGHAEAETVAVVADPVQAGAKTRRWKVASLELVARRTEALKGVLEVRESAGGEVVAQLPFEKGYMEGADEEPLDLASENEIGLPYPLAAYRLSAEGPLVVVLQSAGYEGQSFRLLVQPRSGKPRFHEDSEGLYQCAF